MAVSRLVDENATGHYKSMYQSLEQSFSGEFLLVGQLGLEGPSSIGLFPIALKSTHNFVTPTQILHTRYCEKITEIIRQRGVRLCLFYDGALFDLLLAWQIAARVTNVKIIFNFHYAADWMRKITTQTGKLTFLGLYLKHQLKFRPSNLVLTAESDKLAQVLSLKLSTKLVGYPVHSNITELASRKFGSFETRPTDVYIASHGSELDSWERNLIVELNKLLGFEISIESSNLICDFQPPPNYRRVSKNLSELEYVEQHMKSKIVVIPNVADFYVWGSSGRFQDCLSLGAFPLVPPGTAMAEQYDASFKEGFVDFSPVSVATKVKQILDQGAVIPHPRSVDDARIFLQTVPSQVISSSSTKVPSPAVLCGLSLFSDWPHRFFQAWLSESVTG